MKCLSCGTHQVQRVRLDRWRAMFKCRRCKWYIYDKLNYKEIRDMEIVKEMMEKI